MSGTVLLKECLAVATVNAKDDVLRDADILVEDNRIVEVGYELDEDVDDVVDCAGKVAFPGFVNTHHHLFQVLTRVLPTVQDAKLFDWLTCLYTVWRGVTPEMVHAAAMCGLGELLLTGCTTSADHHYLFPRGTGATMIDEEIRAARALGIRFHPTRGSMSRGTSDGGLPPDDLCQKDRDILKDCVRVIEQYHDPRKFSMCRVGIAPCAPFNVSEGLLRESAALARQKKVRLHTHLGETLEEETYCLQTLGMRPLQFMERVGWLGRDVWFAHGIHFNDEEIPELGRTKTGIAHCATSNLRLGSGIAPIRALVNAGAPVGIAVDGSASNDTSNMLLEVRMAMLVNRIKSGAGSMTARDVLRLATRGGAEVLGREDIGSIEKGKAADIVLFDLEGLAYAGALADPVAAVLFCGYDQRAWLTMVNGEVVVREKELVAFDEQELAADVHAAAAELGSDA